MTFTREGDTVRLEMTVDDWERLLLMLGFATGAGRAKNVPISWDWIRFVNELNRTNPQFTPYEIPQEFL